MPLIGDEIFRVCAWCHKFQWRTDFYCESCWQKILVLRTPLSRPISGGYCGLKVMSLWDWRKQSHRRLARLFYGLKGGHLPATEMRLARLMVQKASKLGWLSPGQGIVIPAPAMRPGARDHAYGLAQAVAEILGLPLWPGLKRQTLGPQKNRSLGDRRELTMTLTAGPPFRGCQRIIFVDDVITTGATSRAAQKALGGSYDFSVWTLAERSRHTERRTLAPPAPP